MAIFNSYVKLPEGSLKFWEKHEHGGVEICCTAKYPDSAERDLVRRPTYHPGPIIKIV